MNRMTGIKRLWRLWLITTWREILATLGWRSFLVTLIINQALTPLIGLMLWSVALPGNSGITAYFIAVLLVNLATVSYEHYTFASSVYNGQISHALLKPQPVVLETVARNVAIRVLFLCAGIPLVILACVIAHVGFTPENLLLALPALVLAALLRFLFIYQLALFSFWGEQTAAVLGLGEMLIGLLGGGALPVQFLPAGLRWLAELLPFNAMMGFPAEIMSGSLHSEQIVAGYVWQLVWIGVWLVLVALVQRLGIRRYTTLGG